MGKFYVRATTATVIEVLRLCLAGGGDMHSSPAATHVAACAVTQRRRCAKGRGRHNGIDPRGIKEAILLPAWCDGVVAQRMAWMAPRQLLQEAVRNKTIVKPYEEGENLMCAMLCCCLMPRGVLEARRACFSQMFVQ